jgi:DNA-binding response OmpR family regulator
MRTRKVAIIDDEPDIVTYLTSALQDNGFDVVSATNAYDGFEIIRAERPDLVCLDILMPEETGFSLYRRIKEDTILKGTRVLIISALSMENEMIPVRQAKTSDSPVSLKPDGFIEKPIDLALFISTVQELAA